MISRFIKIKLEKFLSFDGKIGYLIWKTIESITGAKSTRDINDLSEWLEWPLVALEKWVFGIPNEYQYVSFYIPKKGGRGKRRIDAPNQELKDLQQRVYHKLLKRLNQHRAATGYTLNKSIVDNASPHIGQDVVINIDLKDFFFNISSRRVYNCWRFLGWDIKAAMALTHICCYQKHLPQGAPTSPAISNICNIMLDTRLDSLAKIGDGQYTRYADDLTFSFPIYGDREKRILNKIFKVISSEDYEIQKKKRVRVQRSHQRQTTTGLIVNEKVNLPRAMRRKIRSMQHHRGNKTISAKDLNRLKGYEGLLKMINKANGVIKNNTNKVSILFLAANPHDTAQLYLDEEMRQIDEALIRSRYRDQFDIRSHWAVRTHDLQELMLRYKPKIVHFSGHGSTKSEIILQDEQGNSVSVPQNALGEMFRILSDDIKCVVLNACFSLEQAQAIAKYIPVVVGMSHAISDESAIEFASGFYRALGYGRTVKQAFELACNSIELNNLPDVDKPKLIGKENLSITIPSPIMQ